jgi:hypothetical protein
MQLLKNFPKCYVTRRFITVFIRALHRSLSWARSIQSIPSHPSSPTNNFSPKKIFLLRNVTKGEEPGRLVGEATQAFLRVFENGVLRRIFGPKIDEVTADWRKLRNEELHNLYPSPNIIRMITWRRLRWTVSIARMGAKRKAYRILVGKT